MAGDSGGLAGRSGSGVGSAGGFAGTAGPRAGSTGGPGGGLGRRAASSGGLAGKLALRAGIAGSVIGAGVAVIAGATTGYRGLRQARFAPPTWAFAPAWTLIELALADSTARVIEADRSPERTRALTAAVANDLLYVAFPVVYFRLRSPVLAALVTWSQAGVAAAQFRLTRPVDERAAREILPQLAWLALAAPSGTVQALANPDPLLGTRAPFPKLGRPR